MKQKYINVHIMKENPTEKQALPYNILASGKEQNVTKE